MEYQNRTFNLQENYQRNMMKNQRRKKYFEVKINWPLIYQDGDKLGLIPRLFWACN